MTSKKQITDVNLIKYASDSNLDNVKYSTFAKVCVLCEQYFEPRTNKTICPECQEYWKKLKEKYDNRK